MMMSMNDYYFTSSSDYSGSPTVVRCDGCGYEIGCLTPARAKEFAVNVDWQDEPAFLCAACMKKEE